MIVCSCNRISDRDIAAHCSTSQSVAAAYRSLGCAPKCGRCASTIDKMLKDSRSADCASDCYPGRCDCAAAVQRDAA